jgi:hypothetical protein
MSLDLGQPAFQLETLQNVMSRELGGWDYSDLWANTLQASVPMPFSGPVPFSEALSLPYAATAPR